MNALTGHNLYPYIGSLISSDDEMSVKEFWKMYNIKDAIFNVAAAWDDIQVSNLKNGWNNSGLKLMMANLRKLGMLVSMKLCNCAIMLSLIHI